MNKSVAESPEYGNFVSTRFIYFPGIFGLLLLGFSLVFRPLIVVAIGSLLVSAYFAYARYRFSAAGGDVQGKIQDLVLAHLHWNGNGQAVDIGCGNAPLSVKLAHLYAQAYITGIDYWGGMWEYSKDVCERNAEIEGVAERTVFKQASASALPYCAECFDAAVSNLVFHEVKDTRDKREVIREALRVVKKGGQFAFQDLFLEKRLYGETDELLATIKGWGIERVEFVPTCDTDCIPALLKLPFMVGTMGILHGEK